jgi:hypothetical protein
MRSIGKEKVADIYAEVRETPLADWCTAIPYQGDGTLWCLRRAQHPGIHAGFGTDPEEFPISFFRRIKKGSSARAQARTVKRRRRLLARSRGTR